MPLVLPLWHRDRVEPGGGLRASVVRSMLSERGRRSEAIRTSHHRTHSRRRNGGGRHEPASYARLVFVVVSGLPGSGKTTLARSLSLTLRLPLLDKDDLLETLMDSLGVDGQDSRHRLSRASDALLERIAGASFGAVLTSFWRRESLSATSGTPTDWLRKLPEVVEVFCDCPPRTAAERFHARVRHPGHRDSHQSLADSLGRFTQLASTLPLNLGPVVRVDTTQDVDVPAVAAAVLKARR